MFSLTLKVPISDFLQAFHRLSGKGQTSDTRNPWVQLLEQVMEEASWRVVIIADSRHMAIDLPVNYVNHHINLAGFTKRSMSKPWWKPTIVAAWDSALVRWINTSDSTCPKRKCATITTKVKLLDSQDIDYSVSSKRLSWIAQYKGTCNGNICVHRGNMENSTRVHGDIFQQLHMDRRR